MPVWVSPGTAALRSIAAQASEGHGGLRAANLTAGLVRAAGAPHPRIAVFPDGSPNALLAPAARPVLALSQGLLDSYSRTELEAVVAHCLVRLADRRSLRRAIRAVRLGPWWPAREAIVGGKDDLRAATLTRYPPALAAAITKARAVDGRFAPLFFVAEGPSHRPADERARELLDL